MNLKYLQTYVMHLTFSSFTKVIFKHLILRILHAKVYHFVIIAFYKRVEMHQKQEKLAQTT